MSEGYVSVPGGRVWYEIVGRPAATPLLVLHGGPGLPHDYLEPLREMGLHRRVIFYDQLGCGRSSRAVDRELWSIDRFVDEFARLRAALHLDRLHVFGHSWGSMLALESYLANANGIISLTFASPPFSISRWMQDVNEYRLALPRDVRAALDRHEREGTTGSDEYRRAVDVFDRRHVCLLARWPDCLERALAAMGSAVYETMWGPSECFVNGTLRTYDRTERLADVAVPALFTCGRRDSATPGTVGSYQRRVPNGKTEVFERSAHMAHLEEPAAYLEKVSEHLARVDRGLATLKGIEWPPA